MNTTPRMAAVSAGSSAWIVTGPSRSPDAASTADSEMASRNTGNAHSMSSSQRSTASTTPPAAPASTPNTPASSSVTRVAPAAMPSEVRPPYSRRAATSRPCPSAPSR